MALAVRSERATTVRSRIHGDGASSARVMVKVTSPLPASAPRPQLVVVPRRRRTASIIAVASVFVFTLMMGAAAFQTQLARRQLTLDTLDKRIRTAHEQYDVLRRERAELRSPGRLATEAAALGMVPASQTDFITLDPDVVATVQRSGIPAGTGAQPTIEEEFDQYADVKSQAGTAP